MKQNLVPVSVIVPVKNEMANIERCLGSLQWADQVFVVDSQSTDGTIEKAIEMGTEVIQFHFNGTYPKKKNWALENLAFRNKWVLIVDADEVVTPELHAEIAEAIQKPEYDGYYINFRYHFLGRWIRHCGYYPVWVMRLFRHRLGRYEKMPVCPGAETGDNEAHEHVVLRGRAGYLRNEMLHYPYPDISTWLEKHNRYSSWEAEHYERFRSGDCGETEQFIGSQQRYKRMLKRLYLRLPVRFVFRFFYSYVWKGGFLDGRPGFILCMLLTFYDFFSWAKVHERRLKRLEDWAAGDRQVRPLPMVERPNEKRTR